MEKARQTHDTEELKLKKSEREPEADRDFHDGNVEPHRYGSAHVRAAPLPVLPALLSFACRGSGQHHTGARGGDTYWLHQPVYETSYVESIAPKHKIPKLVRSLGSPAVQLPASGPAGSGTLSACWVLQWHEKTAYWAVTAMRKSFDLITGYGPNMTERKWLVRILFLETVAGDAGSLARCSEPAVQCSCEALHR